MKFILFWLTLTLSLSALSTQNILPNQVLTSTAPSAKQGFAAVNSDTFYRLFFYEDKSFDLMMQTHLNFSQKNYTQHLSFFQATKEIHSTLNLHSEVFLSAVTLEGKIKVALLDKQARLIFPKNIAHLKVNHIYQTFAHKDGTYSIAVNLVNNQDQMSYFDRGMGVRSDAIIRLSSSLEYLSHHTLGNDETERSITMLFDHEQSFYLITQESPTHLSIYTHHYDRETTIKESFTLEKPLDVKSVSSDDFQNFFLGGTNSQWGVLNREDKSFALHTLGKISKATIYSIHRTDENGYLISGEFLNQSSDKDLFIHNYSANFYYLWGRIFSSPYNDTFLIQEINRGTLLTYIGSFNEQRKPTKLLSKLHADGTIITPLSNYNIQKAFNQQLLKSLSPELKEFIRIETDGSISYKHLYGSTLYTLDQQSKQLIEKFFKQLHLLLIDKQFHSHLKQILFQGVSYYTFDKNKHHSAKQLHQLFLKQCKERHCLDIQQKTKIKDLKEHSKGFQTLNYDKLYKPLISIEWK